MIASFVTTDLGRGASSRASASPTSRRTWWRARAWCAPSRRRRSSSSMTRARQRHHRPSPALAAPACSASSSAPASPRGRGGLRRLRRRDHRLPRPRRRSGTSWPRTCRRAICAPSAWPSGWPPTPTVLLLDEPFAGMNHDETMRMVDLVRGVRDARRHRASRRARHAGGDEDLRPDRGASTSARRSPRARPPRSRPDPKVIEAYLGSEDDGDRAVSHDAACSPSTTSSSTTTTSTR